MIYCNLEDCTLASNKCNLCEFNNTCDYPWVAELWKKNSNLLTPLIPGWVKPEFKKHKIISITGNLDFCIFNVPKTKNYITIQDICVDNTLRGSGIAKQLFSYLMETYDRDILAKCIKGSTADSFWDHVGEKIGEEPSKQSILCIYKITNKHKKYIKKELF